MFTYFYCDQTLQDGKSIITCLGCYSCSLQRFVELLFRYKRTWTMDQPHKNLFNQRCPCDVYFDKLSGACAPKSRSKNQQFRFITFLVENDAKIRFLLLRFYFQKLFDSRREVPNFGCFVSSPCKQSE